MGFELESIGSVRVRLRRIFAFCSLGFSLTEYIHAVRVRIRVRVKVRIRVRARVRVKVRVRKM